MSILARNQRRKGFLLQEAMMALALVIAILAGLAQLLGMVAQQRRLARQQAVAMAEAGNLMEELASRSWSRIDAKQVASLGLSAECRRVLPDGQLHVDVVEEDQDTKRISVRIDWRGAAGRRSVPVRLVGWSYRREEAAP